MRYPEGGELTGKDRARREAVRLQAAEMFAQGTSQAEVARLLRVSPMSAGRWYRTWQAGGTAALASKGPELITGFFNETGLSFSLGGDASMMSLSFRFASALRDYVESTTI
ncbi:helix-turn-helix domain-containing protein [Streptosporangium sp. G12]